MLKKGDFVELDYTGRIKDDKLVFDTTIEQIAKDSNIHNPKFRYKPVIICLGEKHLVMGLDNALIGKNPGKHTIEVNAENAFGKKTPDLLKLLPMKLFTKDNVKPFVGLEVNVDETLGIIRSVSGGRVIVDFNHPLASRDLIYDVDVKRTVTDPLEKTKALLELIGIPFEDIDIIDGKAVVTTKTKFPEEEVKELADNIQKLAGLKSLEFKEAAKTEKKEIKEKPKADKKEVKEKNKEPGEEKEKENSSASGGKEKKDL